MSTVSTRTTVTVRLDRDDLIEMLTKHGLAVPECIRDLGLRAIDEDSGNVTEAPLVTSLELTYVVG